VVPYVALDTTLDATSVVKFYRDAKRSPSHLVAQEDLDFSATMKTSLDTIGDTVATNYDTAAIATAVAAKIPNTVS